MEPVDTFMLDLTRNPFVSFIRNVLYNIPVIGAIFSWIGSLFSSEDPRQKAKRELQEKLNSAIDTQAENIRSALRKHTRDLQLKVVESGCYRLAQVLQQMMHIDDELLSIAEAVGGAHEASFRSSPQRHRPSLWTRWIQDMSRAVPKQQGRKDLHNTMNSIRRKMAESETALRREQSIFNDQLQSLFVASQSACLSRDLCYYGIDDSLSASSRPHFDENNLCRSVGLLLNARTLLFGIQPCLVTSAQNSDVQRFVEHTLEQMAAKINRLLPTGVAKRDILSRILVPWQEHLLLLNNTKGKVRIAVVGEYSSGKTSLLKRILLEGSAALLTTGGHAARELLLQQIDGQMEIGSAPTTMRSREIVLLPQELSLIDTPGFQSGRKGDEAEAEMALSMVSAVMIVVPPQVRYGAVPSFAYSHCLTCFLSFQLCTGDTSSMKKAIRVEEEAALLPHLFCISRSDELGADPLLDFGDFLRRCTGKVEELTNIDPLSAQKKDHHDSTIVCAAANPFGLLRSLRVARGEIVMEQNAGLRHVRELERLALSRFSEWDGIARVMEEIAKLRSAVAAVNDDLLLCRRSLFALKQLDAAFETIVKSAQHSAALAKRLYYVAETRIVSRTALDDIEQSSGADTSLRNCPIALCLEHALGCIDAVVRISYRYDNISIAPDDKTVTNTIMRLCFCEHELFLFQFFSWSS